MKSNKGFTLIELLAVIVILAVIALIATPIILNLIEKARLGAAESSAYAYIEAAEKAAVVYMMTDNKVKVKGDCTAAETTLTCSEASPSEAKLTLDVKGEMPESGSITFGENGSVTGAKDLKIGSYYVKFDGSKATASTTASSGS